MDPSAFNLARVRALDEFSLWITFIKDKDFPNAVYSTEMIKLANDSPTETILTVDKNKSSDWKITSALSLEYNADEAILYFKANEAKAFMKQSIHSYLQTPNHTTDEHPVFKIKPHTEEGFYGFGEWFNGYRRTQDTLKLYNLESPAFLQHKHTYSAFPVFISDQGYLVFIINAHKGEVQIDCTNNHFQIDFKGGNLDYLLIYGPRFKDILSRYTHWTGRPAMPPKWVFGLWNTAYPVETQKQTLSRVENHRSKNIPLDAVILDYHWEQNFHDFQWRKSIFPDPDLFLQKMKEYGVKVGLIYTPYMNMDEQTLLKILVRLGVKNTPDGISPFKTDAAQERYNEGLEKQYFAHNRLKWWLGTGACIDFTNQEAVEWWFKPQIKLLKQGIAFFKNDGGEYLPEDSKSANHLTGTELHNVYAFYYTKAVYENTQKNIGNQRALVFSRANWAGTHRYPGIFLGDQTPRFKHIQSTLRCGLNMSLLGYSYWGADIFGLYRKPGKIAHKRYAQWALFNPIARYFSKHKETQRDPWGLDESCYENFKRHIHLRLQLLPLYYTLAAESYRNGIPILRPLLLEYQQDENTMAIWDQFMLGSDILIAPVVEKKVKSRKIYFPKGIWYHWWDDQSFEGPNWIDFPVNEDHLPIFVNQQSILPLGPVLDYIPEDHQFKELALHLYPSVKAQGRLYEDDGQSLNYQNNAFAEQIFQLDYHNANEALITISQRQGDYRDSMNSRRISLIFHDFPQPKSILWNDKEVAWEPSEHYKKRYETILMEADLSQSHTIKVQFE